MQREEKGITVSGLGWILAGLITLVIWRITTIEGLPYTNPPGILALGIFTIICGLALIIQRKKIGAIVRSKYAETRQKHKTPTKRK
jgi:hypothetical protein